MKKVLAVFALAIVCAFALSAQIMYRTPSGDGYAMLSNVTNSSIMLTDSGGSYTFVYKGVSSKSPTTLVFTNGVLDVYIETDLSCFSIFAPDGRSLFFIRVDLISIANRKNDSLEA